MEHHAFARSPEDLGNLISRARQNRGQSQRELAAEFEVGQAWLSRVERGHSKSWIGQVLRLAAHLGVVLYAAPEATSDSGANASASPPAPYPDIDDLV